MSANLIINSTTAATSVVDPLGEDGTIEWIMSKIDQFPIKLSFIFSCAMVIGSIVPYIPQYFTIKQTQNTEGFSLYVCLTLLIANILRIMFWFGKHFETPLLIQSIVMIMAMFILLELCVRVRNSNLIIKQKRRYFSEKDSMKTMLTTSKSNESNHHSKDLSTTTTINLKRSRSLDDCHNEKQYNNRNVYVKKNSITGIIYMMKNSISQTLPKNYHHPHQQQRQNDHSTIDMTTDDDNNNDNSQPKSKNHHFFKQISNLENKMKLVKNQFESNIQQRRQSTNQNTQQQQQQISSPPTTIQNDHHQCSSSNQESSNLSPKQNFDLRFFWEWTDFMSYLECMAVFTLIAGLIFYLFIDVPLIVEGYGLVALVTESLLASPQFFRNLKVKSVEGMSKLMVFTWFLGDLYKTVYFFVRQAPFQFLLCGCTQITFDSLIFMQIICYKKATYRKIPKSRFD
uniref:PQ-loop repeat-containing protein 1-like isoform X3 n=1 Tax=Dermatophagoides pteronyssinus TaxID=6956 RepID=A0A6P6Y905_DERPT|nr:PQ-loop repeat-containing protein 1-like isoform X3 [Dermatophagoides pteronyssinus]